MHKQSRNWTKNFGSGKKVAAPPATEHCNIVDLRISDEIETNFLFSLKVSACFKNKRYKL
jgi:hypothetical protein